MYMPKKKNNDHGTGIPRHEIEAIAQTLYPDLLAFFDSEKGRKEYEEWLKTENKIKGSKKHGKNI
jgi:hypothetical protein